MAFKRTIQAVDTQPPPRLHNPSQCASSAFISMKAHVRKFLTCLGAVVSDRGSIFWPLPNLYFVERESCKVMNLGYWTSTLVNCGSLALRVPRATGQTTTSPFRIQYVVATALGSCGRAGVFEQYGPEDVSARRDRALEELTVLLQPSLRRRATPTSSKDPCCHSGTSSNLLHPLHGFRSAKP